jgi:hypothetical protein
MKLVWQLIGMDISETLRGACWKVLNDRTDLQLGNRRRRRRQARALRVLGEEFLQLGKSLSQNRMLACRDSSVLAGEGEAAAESCTSEVDDEIDLQDRIQVAMFMARTKVRVHSCLYMYVY